MWKLILLTTFAFSQGEEGVPFNDDPWDVDGPCQIYVERFAKAQADMVQCASNWSIPPKVCTNCFEHYITFKQLEYETKHLDNVTSLDNRTCSQVIYDNYLLSYSYDISDALTTRIWDNSRCESCLHIKWNFSYADNNVQFLNRTLAFQNRLFEWRDCVVNFTGWDYGEEDMLNVGNSSEICGVCNKTFNDLFAFYWGIYVKPGVDFCVDIETTMNDTLHLWNDVWKCEERKDRKRDTGLVLYTMIVLLILTVLFYVASYIQGGGATRNLIRYSRLDPPVGQRSRLISTSAADHAYLPIVTERNS
ncbi:unnamed protein product [Auanema sp. JU1783]|nr:unnamed protein product [Auanema sp. JU1783]